ncbi:hypothetical protein [Undibacterium luofuense]|uniref:Uncharacterized protein n=1 Tax=Undibacterium luofuense TaxID=2828733 RepID=A0A941DLT4_9BURK|nr:hypothetical protein [Undibacterium luofuense]MBR7782384.1 hypothetical protein [Undibacterium luofuense]
MYAGALYGGFGSNCGGAALRQNNALKYVSLVADGTGFALKVPACEQVGSLRTSFYAGASVFHSNGRDDVALAYGEFRDQTGTASLHARAAGVKWRPSDNWAVRMSYAGDIVRGDVSIPVSGNPQANANGRRITVTGMGIDYQYSPQLVSTVAAYQSQRSGDLSGKAAQYLLITKLQPQYMNRSVRLADTGNCRFCRHAGYDAGAGADRHWQRLPFSMACCQRHAACVLTKFVALKRVNCPEKCAET